MADISVLIVVDVVGAATHGLGGNIYLVDTTGYMGSTAEGKPELVTQVTEGQIVTWQVAPVDASTNVEIAGFTGQMINDKICVPTVQGISNHVFWEGLVEAQGVKGDQQYSVSLTVDDTPMSWDPHLYIS
ncbi:MAG TPA: hypothetical protein VGO60_08775 [Iamia sp.]|nr:hypothetical protein [Iamia sp.]